MALNRMELLQRTLVMMDSTFMEMPLGYASMDIGRVLNLCAQQVSPGYINVCVCMVYSVVDFLSLPFPLTNYITTVLHGDNLLSLCAHNY